MATAEKTIELRELIGESRVAMATTSTPAGELHSRPLTIGDVDDRGLLHFLVDIDAAWVRGLRDGDAINLAIIDDDDQVWVSIAGTASVTDDRAAAHRLWSSDAEAFFPDGPIESPNLRVLVVDPSTCEYWDAPSSRLARLAMKAGSMVGRGDSRSDSGNIDLG